jgi:hypothetical protein
LWIQTRDQRIEVAGSLDFDFVVFDEVGGQSLIQIWAVVVEIAVLRRFLVVYDIIDAVSKYCYTVSL